MCGDGAFQSLAEVVDVTLATTDEVGGFDSLCQEAGRTLELIDETPRACDRINALDIAFFQHLLQNCGLASRAVGCEREDIGETPQHAFV